MVTFLDATGIRPLESAKRLQREAFRAWMLGLLCNALAGFYVLWQLRAREEKVDRKEGEGKLEAKKIERYVRSICGLGSWRGK